MQIKNSFIDELTCLANTAFGTMNGVKTECNSIAQSKIKKLMLKMDFITEENIESLRDITFVSQNKISDLEKKISDLEKKISDLEDIGKILDK